MVIESKNLTFSYNEHKKFSFPDFSCSAKETLLILGNSGKGKTTLLHLLALLQTPTGGSIRLKGEEISQLSPKNAAKMRAENIGIIYQKSHFVASLSVLDNLLLANYLADKKQSVERATELARSLGFAEHLNKKTTQLSQGEQQRVSIARALMNNPSIILADEPTSSLDDENCEKVIQLLDNQSNKIGAALIIVTHDQRLKDRFSNRVML
ncbi:MAG: ATP-binding cassette domain-containing protein [Spirosomaceae bacterium]|jgi:putative ABC transport system ATP-binding protein|nr:ATP-binding cassette domain-containing protein [Spirosomataceae bacterium]